MSYTGEVTTTSPTAHTITVRHGNRTETFRISRLTKLSIPERREAKLKDFEFGNKVTVRYHDTAKGVTAVTVQENAAK